jgi:hypothetical protein
VFLRQLFAANLLYLSYLCGSPIFVGVVGFRLKMKRDPTNNFAGEKLATEIHEIREEEKTNGENPNAFIRGNFKLGISLPVYGLPV